MSQLARVLGILPDLNSDLRKRIFAIVVFFIFSLASVFSGTITANVSIQEAKRLQDELDEEFQRMNDPRFIFGNNLIHTLVMFTPLMGPVWGCFVLFNTGRIIAFFSIAEGVPAMLTFMLLLINPILWLELGVYSTAMAQSVLLLIRIIQRRGVREAIRTCIVITACVVVLLISAIAEWIIINA
jgi:hypothetical protein